MEINVSLVFTSMLSLKGGTCLKIMPSVMSACPVWFVKTVRVEDSAAEESEATSVSCFSIFSSNVMVMVPSLS